MTLNKFANGCVLLAFGVSTVKHDVSYAIGFGALYLSSRMYDLHDQVMKELRKLTSGAGK